MNRKEQFKLFYDIYKTELERYEQLTKRGTIYLSIITLFVAIAGYSINALSKSVSQNYCLLIGFSLSAVLLIASVIYTILSLRIFAYKEICDIQDIVIEIDNEKYEEEDTYAILLANIASASRDNHKIMEMRAQYLQKSSLFILLGTSLFLILTLVGAILNIIK